MKTGNATLNVEFMLSLLPMRSTITKKISREMTRTSHMGTAPMMYSDDEPRTEVCMIPTTPTRTKKQAYTGIAK